MPVFSHSWAPSRSVTAHSAGSLDRLSHLLSEHGTGNFQVVGTWAEAAELTPTTLGLVVLGIEQGFGTPALTVISEQDILGERLARPTAKRKRPENFLTEVAALYEGDVVVHVEHGIGRYERLETLDVGGAPHDCLRLVYHGGDKLFLPVENIEALVSAVQQWSGREAP